MRKINIYLKLFNTLITIICVSCNRTSDINSNFVFPLEKLEGRDDITTPKTSEDYDVQSKLVLDFFDEDVLESGEPNTTLYLITNTHKITPTLTKLLKFIDVTRTTKQLTKEKTLLKYNVTSIQAATKLMKFIGVTRTRMKSPKRTTFLEHNSTIKPIPPSTTPSTTVLMKFIGVARTTTQLLKTPSLFNNMSSLSSNNTDDGGDLKTILREKLKESGITTAQETTNPIRNTTADQEDNENDIEMNTEPISKATEEDLDLHEMSKTKLLCIVCDNVSNKDCNHPKNKLLPVIRCEHVSDICYTMQTPFGVVVRGCYKPLMEPSTYVCSCNLCNAIPIHDLPYTFTNKKDWLFDMQELNHMSKLRKSIYSQMSCVHCEVNQTVDDFPDIDCLQGKVRALPFEECDSDEICGIRSIKNQGYVWRGCVRSPRYNYLWKFCKTDLCNFDSPTSVFHIE